MTSRLCVGAMRDGRRRRLTAATVREGPGAGGLYAALCCSVTLLPLSRIESLTKEGQEDTGYETHSTRFCSVVAGRTRAVVFYSLRNVEAPGARQDISELELLWEHARSARKT